MYAVVHGHAFHFEKMKGLCVCVCVCDHFWLPCQIGSHMPSSEDVSPFLEGGCCCAKRLAWLKIVPPDREAHTILMRSPGALSGWCRCVVTCTAQAEVEL